MTNASWLVTTIKAILKTPTRKFGNPFFLFRRTHKAAFQSLQKISHMQQLTHAQKENLSTNVHGNQQNIYDRNIQHQ